MEEYLTDSFITKLNLIESKYEQLAAEQQQVLRIINTLETQLAQLCDTSSKMQIDKQSQRIAKIRDKLLLVNKQLENSLSKLALADPSTNH